MEGQCNKESFINSFFTVTGVVTVSVLISSAIIGYYCYSKEEKEEEPDIIEIYQRQYLDEFYELDERDLSDNELKNFEEVYFRTTTPQGEIIMSYNQEAGTFWYYADKTEVSFKTLETVARQYCIVNDCKILYVDPEKEKKNKEEADAKEEELKKEENKSVFIEYKTYNAPLSKYIINSNRFTKKGRIDEWEKKEKTKTEKKDKNVMNSLDFNMFKQLSASGEIQQLL